MSPTEWQAWNFGVLLAFALLGIGIGINNLAVIITGIIILIVLYNHKRKEENKEEKVEVYEQMR